jgi:phage baseplate assembly protein W
MIVYKSFSAFAGNTKYLVDGAFQWDMEVLENSVELVLSNVFNILATPFGTQPLLRAFGLSMRWIDQPGSLGIMQARTAALLSISIWEPRAHVRALDFILNPGDVMAGIYDVRIELEVDLSLPVNTALFAPPAPVNTWVLDAPFDGVTVPTAMQELLTL